MQFAQPLAGLSVINQLGVIQLSGAGAGNQSINLTAGIRTLIVSTTNPAATLTVTGNQSGLQYYNSTPYLPDGNVVIPIVGSLDSSVNVNITGGAANGLASVVGDVAQYPESTFYNGPVVPVANNTSGTVNLAVGPVRLLTGSISLAGAAAPLGAALEINGVPVLDVQAIGQIVALTFGANTIVPRGQDVSLVCSNAASQLIGEITYAYP